MAAYAAQRGKHDRRRGSVGAVVGGHGHPYPCPLASSRHCWCTSTSRRGGGVVFPVVQGPWGACCWIRPGPMGMGVSEMSSTRRAMCWRLARDNVVMDRSG